MTFIARFLLSSMLLVALLAYGLGDVRFWLVAVLFWWLFPHRHAVNPQAAS